MAGNDLTETIPESNSSLPLVYFHAGGTQLVGNLTKICNKSEFQTETNFFANCPPDVLLVRIADLTGSHVAVVNV